MTITPDQYEKPGVFYLGREHDLQSGSLTDDLVLYDSRDLVTHGVVLGMTGSGKTGLCLALLEEAAMDSIPVIAIDPKGDIGNALLTFPALSAADFAPWVNPDDARRKEMDTAAFAEAQSASWRKGLEEWGQSGERIRKLRETVDMAIYTPGSNAGLPVSILSSLDVPPTAVLEDSEALLDRIESTVSSLLGLTGIEPDPVQSPEHVLLSTIVAHCWSHGDNLTLESLIQHVQQPPFRKVGVMDVDTFLPENARRALAMKINSIVASPGFSNWLNGEALDIQRMFYTAEGKPRISIFNIAHLSDSERMFFVSLLLNQLLGWMRTQQGTTSLRALFYMDEIFGYLPPTAMPPSKKPMLQLLKQARAFGLGMLLATQNPVDLDYKALSNIGTWWLGRLQTDRDRARVLDGLEGSAERAGAIDRNTLDRMIGGLSNRVFLMNNVHDNAPTVFSVRWVMSYMAGPLAREQIKRLTEGRRRGSVSAAAGAGVGENDGFLPPPSTTVAAAATGTPLSGVRPGLPDGTTELFETPAFGGALVVYTPCVVRSAVVTVSDDKKGISGATHVTLVNRIDSASARVLWEDFADIPRDTDIASFRGAPAEGASFAPLPGAALKSATWTAISKDFVDWVYNNTSVDVSYAPLLDLYSAPGERTDEFRARVAHLAREKRDGAVDVLREKANKAARTLEDRAARASVKVETQKSQASTARLTTAMTIGQTILGAFLGKKTRGSPLKTAHVNSGARVFREGREAAAAEAELKRVQEDITRLQNELNDETNAIRDMYDPATLVLETKKLKPLKKNIRVAGVGILWVGREA